MYSGSLKNVKPPTRIVASVGKKKTILIMKAGDHWFLVRGKRK